MQATALRAGAGRRKDLLCGNDGSSQSGDLPVPSFSPFQDFGCNCIVRLPEASQDLCFLMTVNTECFAGAQTEAAKVAQTRKVSFKKKIPSKKLKQKKKPTLKKRLCKCFREDEKLSIPN